MAHVAWLTLKGAKQGLISGGCNTKDSMGNRYQETHTDQITVLACHYSLSKLPNQHGVHHDGIQITKPKDKASPLLATAFARKEYLEGSIDFYRTNDRGHYERFYSVAFQKAVICEVTDMSPHAVHSPGEDMHEMITFRYKGVQWEHFPCGTLAYDGWTDANSLAAMAPPLSTAERYAEQIKEMVQAEKTAERQAAKAQQSWQKSVLPEKPETEEEKKTVPQRFARSVTVPDGTCEVGMQRESLSGIGLYAAYALAIERTGEQVLSRVAGQALAELPGMMMKVLGRAGILAALAPTKMGDGTLYTEDEIRQQDMVKTNIRLGFDASGQLYGYHVDGDSIPKRTVTQNGDKFEVTLEEGLTIEWVPLSGDFGGQPILVNPIPELESHDIWIHPQADQGKEFEKTYITPVADADLKDYILVFPADTGLPPLYVVFKGSARDEPGVVTGQGEDMTGIWLEKAGEELGSPVPSQIADKLRGQRFSSFDKFRKAFWLAVSEDRQLKTQFIGNNIDRMSKGYAPRARKKDSVGKRQSFEIHHVEEIQHGGKVYDVDNLRVLTPQRHIDIHKGNK